jgi:hypothetical protein
MSEEALDVICCNVCRVSLDGMCCKTTCSHLLCYQCASDAFTSGYACPVCGSLLSQSDVQKVEVGEKINVDISETMFAFVMKSKDWTSIINNIASTVHGIKELSLFFNRQLDLDRSLASNTARTAIEEIKLYKAEIVSIKSKFLTLSLIDSVVLDSSDGES